MNSQENVVEIDNNKPQTKNQKIISVTDPLKAFQVILANADERYIHKLGALLVNVSTVLSNDRSMPEARG